MAKSITYDQWDFGLDRRRGRSVADANRLYECQNAHITNGKVMKKRPGTTKIATLEAGTRGLVSAGGKLQTFYESGAISHANSLFNPNQVSHPTISQNVLRVHHAEVYAGYVYVSVEYVDNSVWHHYLDGSSPTHVEDVSCPHSKSFIKLSSKIWGIGDEVTRFTATDTPRDWTTANDAGFLPTGRGQTGSRDVLALGQYQKQLVAQFADASQVWITDPDPDLHVLKQTIDGVGCRYPGSVRGFGGEMLFLSDAGYRSIIRTSQNDSMTDNDVGSPIDAVVEPLLAGGNTPISASYKGGGQYWCAVGSAIHVYTFSRSNKIRAWSEYEMGITIDAFSELDGVLYFRSGDDVFKVDESVSTDDGVAFEMLVEMPFVDFKKPGVLKQIIGMDAVVQGSVDIQFRYDPRDPSMITEKMTLSGDTRPGGMIPLGLTSTGIAPVFTSSSSSDVQIDSITFYYEELGVM